MSRAVTWFWEKQPVKLLDVDPPSQDTYYNLLDTEKYCLAWYLLTHQTNDEIDAKDIEMKVTADSSNLSVRSRLHANDTWYYWYVQGSLKRFYETTTEVNCNWYTPFKARSLKIEVGFLDTPGTSQELDARLFYAIRREH